MIMKGMGHQFAQELRSRGHRVFATARTLEKMTDLAALGCEVCRYRPAPSFRK